jgi:hypothetical protein
MSNEAFGDDPGITRVPHAGRVISLRGPVAQVLTLKSTEPLVLDWQPENKEAGEIELRARMIGVVPPTIGIPIVRWSTETGHGDMVWREPQPNLPNISIEPSEPFTLPGRGMLFRTSARQFRITMFTEGGALGGVITESAIRVSVNPCWGERWEASPYSDSIRKVGVGQIVAMPIHAREWRLSGVSGLPVPIGGTDVRLLSLTGFVIALEDAALYADWAPIPHDVASYQPVTGAVFAHYR